MTLAATALGIIGLGFIAAAFVLAGRADDAADEHASNLGIGAD